MARLPLLTLRQADNIRAAYPEQTMPALARKYQISKSTIHRIVHRQIKGHNHAV